MCLQCMLTQKLGAELSGVLPSSIVGEINIKP
jgi:hypothetical protein